MSNSPTNAIGNSVVSLSLDTPELAATYEQESYRQFNHGKILIESLELKTGEHVLDIGCGTGRLGEYVTGIVGPTGQVIGIDPLPLRIGIARNKDVNNFKTFVGHAEDLSQFASASFDAVYLSSVFHWIAETSLALQEIFRVLKPHGRIALNSADAEHPHQSKLLVSQALAEEGVDAQKVSKIGSSRPISAAELGKHLSSAGFTDFSARTHDFEDTIDDVEQLVRFSNSSSFGNFLPGLNEEESTRVCKRLAKLLEAQRTAKGIRLQRHLVFALARKN